MINIKALNSEKDGFLVLNKPSGFNTHAQDIQHPGFVEIASRCLKKDLTVVHRLDQGTSGILIASLNKETTQAFFEIFQKHEIKKEYLFVTDRRGLNESTVFVSGIIEEEKPGSSKKFALKTPQKHSQPPGFLKANDSLTEFRFIESFGPYQLWRALPQTGRPHQIRLHAQFLGLSILGDPLYAGSEFHRLMLHAEKVEFNLAEQTYQFELPFAEVAVMKTQLAFLWPLLFGEINRQRFIKISPKETWRILHNENKSYHLDRYGHADWFYWYEENDPPTEWLEALTNFYQQKTFFVRKMHNRGGDPNTKKIWQHLDSHNSDLQVEGEKVSWVAEENGRKYLLHNDQGQSPGLFLDQRDQRQWVFENSKNKKVLNLFSYTCGFSLCAALGGAQKVTSVDVSRNFLSWGEKNFSLNNTDPKDHEFFYQDVPLFIKGTKKRSRSFDLIICDPPSFGRSKDSVWKLEKDLAPLMQDLIEILTPKGHLLLTCNYEGWSEIDFVTYCERALKKHKIKILRRLRSSLDHEPSQQQSLLKGLLIEKI